MAGVTPAANGETRTASPRSDRHIVRKVETRLSGAGVTIISPGALKRYRGLALRSDKANAELMSVALVGRDGGEFTIGTFDEEEVIAIWRGIAALLARPLMLECADGSLDVVKPQIGPLLLGATRIRRRQPLLGGRRPRFLVRRKTGQMPLRPVIYRGGPAACP